MLKQRFITAIALIPLVFLAILYLESSLFKWLVAAVIGLAALEWFSIIGYNTNLGRIMTLALLLAALVLSQFIQLATIITISLGFWLAITLLIVSFAHKSLPAFISRAFQQKHLALLIAILALSLLWISVAELHSASPLGPKQVLYVMVLVWLADTGGYFAGKRWGKTALAKAISPNKTWEGVAGAIVLGAIWALLAYQFGIAGELSLVSWSILSLITLLVSVVGDLFESVFKRLHQIKDSGNLLPGHGGMLDRVDSLLAAVPVFTAGLYFLGAL
ncbi:MAG: phosphatidate cytidylyltransferase [Gammaproteobacteria bacterium]|nr:phosphatidate cytidylyltransferase [Gammaproteobacteria bacterium]